MKAGVAIHLRMTHGIGTTRQAKRRRMLGMERAIRVIRRAVANYMGSEGCGCCGNREAHVTHTEQLAKLLSVPLYNDGSGYDFRRYRKEAP